MTPVAGRWGQKSIGLAPLLLSLFLIATVPILLYGAFLLYLMAGQAKTATQRELTDGAAELRTAIEREFELAQEALKLVIASPALARRGPPDAEPLNSLVRAITQGNFGFDRVVLLDAQGRVAVEYPQRSGPGSPPVRLGPPQEQALHTGRPVLSTLHPSPLDGRLTLSMAVPVRRQEDNNAWLLTAELNPQRLAEVMSAHVGQRDAVATLLDPQQRIVARTRAMDRFFGQYPSRQTFEALATGRRGTQRFATRDGNELLWAWETTPDGWTLLMGTPARAVDAVLRDMMVRLALVGLAVLGLGAAAAYLVARRITRSVDVMAENAHKMAQGTSPTYRVTGIRQLDALYLALQEAGNQVVQAFAERERALSAERAARAVADEHNQAKDVFIATLSHELRNPLSPISAAAQLLKSPRADAAQRLWAAEVIDRQAAAMARLLNDLLDISRVSRGRIVLDRQPVWLDDVLQQALEVAQPLVANKHHTLKTRLLDEPVMLDADPLRLAQVFGNLLTNAAKYTPHGGVIELSAGLRGPEVVVTVRDNGIGLAPESLHRIFEMFAQVRGPQDPSQGGLGIGLALVKGLVELHGGWVRADSEGLGRGSTFTVGLPVCQAPAPDPEPSAPPAGLPARTGKPLRVLVADDNEDAAQALEQVLALAGHEVRVVHGGLDALSCAQVWRPDVACLDIGMPDLSGYEAARRIRAEPWGQDMRLIAITGWGTPEDKLAAQRAGFDAHLAKPADMQALARLLDPR